MPDDLLDPIEAARRVKAQRAETSVLDPVAAARMVKMGATTTVSPAPWGSEPPEQARQRYAQRDAEHERLVREFYAQGLDKPHPATMSPEEAAAVSNFTPGGVAFNYAKGVVRNATHSLLDPLAQHAARVAQSRKNARELEQLKAERVARNGPAFDVARPVMTGTEESLDFLKVIPKTLWGAGGAMLSPITTALDPKTFIPDTTMKGPLEAWSEGVHDVTKGMTISPPSFLVRSPDRPIDPNVLASESPNANVGEEAAFVLENAPLLAAGGLAHKALKGKAPVEGSRAEVAAREYHPPPSSIAGLEGRVDIRPEGESQARSGKPLVEFPEGRAVEGRSYQELAETPPAPPPQARVVSPMEAVRIVRERKTAEPAPPPAEAPVRPAEAVSETQKAPAPTSQGVPAATGEALSSAAPPEGAGATLGAQPRGQAEPVTLHAGVDPLDLMARMARLGAAPERLYQKGTEKVGRGVSKVVDVVPGARPTVNWAQSWLKTPEENISSKYAAAKEGGRGEVRVGRAEGAYFGKKIEESLAGASDPDRRGVYDYLIGDSNNLPSSITPAQKAAIDEVSAFIDQGRTDLVNRGRLSPDAYDEFNRYLRRQFQNVELGREAQKGARPFSASGDKPRLDERWSRQDAYEMRVDLPRGDVDFLLSEFPNFTRPSYVGELKGTTMVKFPDSPAGQAARDAFVDHVKTSYRQGRANLQGLATREMKASDPTAVRSLRTTAESVPTAAEAAELGASPVEAAEAAKAKANLHAQSRAAMNTVDVGQAKMLHQAALETPTAGELSIKTADPLSPEMRELMGEDTNPATAVAKTIANVRAEVAKFDTMQSILDGRDEKGAWAVRRQPGQKPSDAPDGYKHIANKRLGPLDDTFVRNDVAADLEGVYGNRSPSGPDQVADFFRGATDRWKTWRTVRNPAGHVQNAISMPMTAIEAGVSPFNPDNWKHYQETIRAMQNPDPFDPIQREIIRNGIDEGARLSAYELGKVRDVWGNPNSTTGYKIGQTLTDPVWWTKTAADFDQTAGAYYNFADRLVRQSLYRKLRAEGMTPERATIETDKFTTNYAKQGRFIQGMRHAPLSPFISYAYERLRVLKNNLLEHPTRAGATLTAGYALQQAIESTLGSGVSDEEKKAAHAEYGGSRWGDFGNQFNIVVGRRADGMPRVWDAGALFTVDRPLRGPRDELDESKLEQNAKWVLKTLGFESGPLTTQLASQIYGRDMFTGKEFLTPGDRLRSFGREVAPPFTPFLGAKAEKIRQSFGGEQYAKSKPPISGGEALMDALLHIRLDGYSPEQSSLNIVRAADRASERNNRIFNEEIDRAGEDSERAERAGATLGASEEDLWRRVAEKLGVHDAATLGAGAK